MFAVKASAILRAMNKSWGFLALSVLLCLGCAEKVATPAGIEQSFFDLTRVSEKNLSAEFARHAESFQNLKATDGVVGQFAQARFGLQSWTLTLHAADEPATQLTLEYKHKVRGELILAGSGRDGWKSTFKGNGLLFPHIQDKTHTIAIPLTLDFTKTGNEMAKWAELRADMQSTKVDALRLHSLDDSKMLHSLVLGCAMNNEPQKTSSGKPYYFCKSGERLHGVFFSTPKAGFLDVGVVRYEIAGSTQGKDVANYQLFRMQPY